MQQVQEAEGAAEGQQQQPLVDRVAQWEAIAAQEYKADGIADGWDSEPEEEETAEQKYIKARMHAFWHASMQISALW